MSEQTEEEYLIERLSKLLAEISVIVNGPQPMGVLWSYADLPEKVQALKDAASQPQASAEDYPGLLGAIARGWCHPRNTGKTIDPELAESIASEVSEFIKNNHAKE